MPELTVSEQIFNSKPDSFIKEHISHLLVQQFNKSYKTEISNGLVAFCFYFDHALMIASSKKGEIYSYQRMDYNSMLPDSFLQSLYLHSYLLPSHWNKWLENSRSDLIRKEFSQSLNFNRLKVSYSFYENIFFWNWKTYNITFLMNSSFVYEDIRI
ncbi:hypothetical protein MNQ98_04850 [Paenibacillus sp. N3/727]|uniref:hypothetical protein n=1 Tax=Paenibacillus sp. N3/727 TaxID=2925845 RepID=UPI001F53721D|nr:hypothetical protein [Paenibacillus sp. N3/727]UNK19365.1 hypothetical protein MNQ98_04850 [Paenibacillus sp. N3/727]